jgi:predicted PhzF superfamily epimerase YddE/YHI9
MVVQECGAGLIPIRRNDDGLAFGAPPLVRSGPVDADLDRYDGDGSLDLGLIGPYPDGSACAFEVRGLFSDEHGDLVEDPVTGSLNASLAQWLLTSGRATAPYVASQGTRLGRAGRPRIDQGTDGTVWVGGTTVTCVEGKVRLGRDPHISGQPAPPTRS